jgi:hypothetical protein
MERNEKLDNKYGVVIDGHIFAIGCAGSLSSGQFKLGRNIDINGFVYYELNEVSDTLVSDYTHTCIELNEIEKRFKQLIEPIDTLSLGTKEEPFEVEVFRYSVDYNPKEWVSMFASISRNKKASNNPELRYKLLLKETFAGGPSRPLQLEPVVLDNKDDVLTDEQLMFCGNNEERFILANRRLVLENPRLKEIEMHSNVGEVKRLLESYCVFRIKTTHEKWDAITHRQSVGATTIAQSNRYTSTSSQLQKPVCEYAGRPCGANGLTEKTFIIDGFCNGGAETYINTVNSLCALSCIDNRKLLTTKHNGVDKFERHIRLCIVVPKFVADQLATHKTLFLYMDTVTLDKEYFIPDDFHERLEKYSGHNKFLGDVKESLDANKEIKNGYHTINMYMDAFKELGYPKEIYQRYPHHAAYTAITMDGTDEYWEKFFIERGAIGDNKGKNHTQQCTKDAVKKMYKMYKFAKEEL